MLDTDKVLIDLKAGIASPTEFEGKIDVVVSDQLTIKTCPFAATVSCMALNDDEMVGWGYGSRRQSSRGGAYAKRALGVT
ncbi:hypothetical protein THAOC_12872 [Thalassiosira oceanica]|uniref:Uncharacterized protein n=1 Tax=Thalassiosira oceanica TaxID=159749 RepID=K0T745_THAOC|nr:hypothetical protein THAOC_12872 [Thalassiosira oceanica]|eukprot:EJK66222.1 hypothetical protein THAOC_12872 [Thalassiosira oceanica]